MKLTKNNSILKIATASREKLLKLDTRCKIPRYSNTEKKNHRVTDSA